MIVKTDRAGYNHFWLQPYFLLLVLAVVVGSWILQKLLTAEGKAMKFMMPIVSALLIITTVEHASAYKANLKANYVLGATKEACEECNKYLAQKDFPAFMQMVNAGMCSLTKAGVQVDVIDQSLLNGLAKIRKIGTAGTLWTPIEAVK